MPPGQPGELIVRSDEPWIFNSGYEGEPGATAAAWRNGWFHTGDIMRKEVLVAVVPKAGIALAMEKKLSLESLISHRIALGEIENGFEMLASGQSLRTVVVF